MPEHFASAAHSVRITTEPVSHYEPYHAIGVFFFFGSYFGLTAILCQQRIRDTKNINRSYLWGRNELAAQAFITEMLCSGSVLSWIVLRDECEGVRKTRCSAAAGSVFIIKWKWQVKYAWRKIKELNTHIHTAPMWSNSIHYTVLRVSVLPSVCGKDGIAP